MSRYLIRDENAHIIPILKNVRNSSTKRTMCGNFEATITVSTFDIKSLFIMNVKYSLACPIKISSRGLGGFNQAVNRQDSVWHCFRYYIYLNDNKVLL